MDTTEQTINQKSQEKSDNINKFKTFLGAIIGIVAVCSLIIAIICGLSMKYISVIPDEIIILLGMFCTAIALIVVLMIYLYRENSPADME